MDDLIVDKTLTRPAARAAALIGPLRAAAAVLACLSTSGHAQAAMPPVDVALVLVTDVSRPIGRTAIASGIEFATTMLADPAFAAAHRVIDVAGDGTSNAGRPVAEARDGAVEAGITINGLAIINDHPVADTFAHVQPPGGLTNYYRENVTGGPGSFVVEVHDFGTFGDAMTGKLVNEIAALPIFHG